MFTINLPFTDALACYETLSQRKKKDELSSIEQEFFRYAKKRAKVGDNAAQAWLKTHPDVPQMMVSPMSYFARKSHEDKAHKFEVLSGVSHPLPVEAKPDLPPQDFSPKDVDQAMEHLEALVGLGQIKQQIRQILEAKIIEGRRLKAGLKVMEAPCHHMVFLGNPGTGKTSVARLLGKVYKTLGLLSSGHLVEVGRGDLIGEFIGQTEQVMKATLKKAAGGVLFIDEAYSLHKPDSPNDFGHDVISALMKYMEDHRDDMVVIMAGYTDQMGALLRSNPGLKSRFAHHFHFEDMKEDHLVEIFKSLCFDYDYDLDEAAEKQVHLLVKEMKRKDESEFPNARGARLLFEDVIRAQSERILKQNLRAKAKLREITAEDIPTSRTLRSGNVIHLPRN